MTNGYQPIDDRDGDMDCKSAFEEVLISLFERKIPLKKQRRIKVLISTIVDNDDHPYRVNITKVYTFGYLCRLYRKYYKKDFNPTGCGNKKNFNLEVMERRAEGRAAWGLYSYLTSMRNGSFPSGQMYIG